MLQRLAGQGMLTLLQRQPWRVLGLARALATAHLAIHAVRMPGGLPDLREVLAARIEDAGGRVGVIDWVGAARGVPEADHARTLLLLRRADPLPGTPVLSRTLMAVGRSMFTRGYTRAYAGGSARPLEQVNAWLIVHTAARLSKGIAVELPTLLGLLDDARHRASQHPTGRNGGAGL